MLLLPEPIVRKNGKIFKIYRAVPVKVFGQKHLLPQPPFRENLQVSIIHYIIGIEVGNIAGWRFRHARLRNAAESAHINLLAVEPMLQIPPPFLLDELPVKVQSVSFKVLSLISTPPPLLVAELLMNVQLTAVTTLP